MLQGTRRTGCLCGVVLRGLRSGSVSSGTRRLKHIDRIAMTHCVCCAAPHGGGRPTSVPIGGLSQLVMELVFDI